MKFPAVWMADDEVGYERALAQINDFLARLQLPFAFRLCPVRCELLFYRGPVRNIIQVMRAKLSLAAFKLEHSAAAHLQLDLRFHNPAFAKQKRRQKYRH